MPHEPNFTVPGIAASSPFPWSSQLNYNLRGNCRMVDAAGKEVPLVTMMAFAGIMSNEVASQKPAQAST